MPFLDTWRYCPRCRRDLAVADGRAACASCDFVVYASSQPTACALCVDDDGRLLLARRAGAPFQGFWDLPGGFLAEGEHPVDAVRREVREETGLEIDVEDFLGIWMDWYGDGGAGPGVVATLNLYWTARVVSGQATAADDVAELRWFAPDELPAGDRLAFTNVAEAVSAWRQQQA